jgi:uncharacterized membrane protein
MTAVAANRHQDFMRIMYSLMFSTLMTIVLLLIGSYQAKSDYYFFLIFNMFLAFLPVLIAWWLVNRLKISPWLSMGNIILTILWLICLPNSFYMITDLIHAGESVGIDVLYNIVLIFLCIFNALVAGYISLYLVHWALLKRFYYRKVHIVIGLILLMCSFAIYLGRYLRWNSWDVIVSPFGLLFDATDSIANPSTHPDVFVTTATFFLLLTTMYIVIWQVTRVLKKSR